MTKKYIYTTKTGRPRIYESPDDMAEMIDKYFEEEKIPTKTGLAMYLGFVDKVSLKDYGKRDEFSTLIKDALNRLELWWEQKLAGTCVTGSIFWLKNNAGYTDRQDINHSGSVELKSPEIG